MKHYKKPEFVSAELIVDRMTATSPGAHEEIGDQNQLTRRNLWTEEEGE